MAYTMEQLTTFFTNANAGTGPTGAQTLALQAIYTEANAPGGTNEVALAKVINLASDYTTGVSVQAYQFFLGYAPSEAGLAALNAAYVGTGSQAALNGENRFIAQSISLALQNPTAKATFTASYGSLSIEAATRAAYDIIIGNSAAKAAGVNIDAAIKFFTDQTAYFTAFVKQVLPNATADEQALAVKAAIIGEIMYQGQKYNDGAGLGAYAAASTNLLKDLSDDGHLTANNNAGVDLFANYGSGGTGTTFKLTAGIDGIGSFTGTSGNDTFVGNTDAGVLAYTSLDAIDGGTGTDTLSISVVGAVDTTAAVGASVKNIEKVVITSTGAVTTDTTSWTGVTSLTTSSIGNSTLTASTTTDVTATVAAPTGAGAAVINGGKAVTLAVSDTAAADVATGNTVSIGATTAATGAVVVTQSETFAASANAAVSALAGGSITVNGGTTVNVTNTASVGAGDNAGDVVTLGTVTVNGKGTATSVSVTQSASTAAWATAGDKYKITAGAVVITDNNTATKSDTITSVSLTNYGASTFQGNALTTLTLAGGSSASSASGTFSISQSAGLTTAAPTALTINASGRLGAITDTNNQYTSLNIVSDKAATIADLDFTSVKTLAVSGAAITTISALTDLSSATSITSTGAGVTITPTLGNSVAFTGGAGVESITLGATTKAIAMGAGNDVVTLTTTTLGAGGSVNGGDGTDVLVANTNGSSFSADPAFGGFETLRVAGAAAQGSHNANGFTALELGATAGATTFTNVAVNVGLTILAAPTGGATVTLANATGTSDSFALTLSSSGTLAAGSVTLAGVETVNIAANDTDTTAHVDSLTLVATSAKSIVVTGSAGLNLTNSGNVNVTSFDASASTGDVTYASVNATVGEVVSIKGGAGADTLTGTASAVDTIIGGAGADTLVHNGGADVFTGGAGADTFVTSALGTKTTYLTITDATTGDKLDVAGITTAAAGAGTIGAAVSLGAAATFDQYLDSAAAGTGAAAALVTWFQFEGNTYVVVDNSAGATFGAGDSLIKLAGLVNLQGSAISAADVITIA